MFDTVNHDILLKKLEYYGVRGIVITLFRSYLTNRKQYVMGNNISSSLLPITIDVPQGSVLGSFFFAAYINDITKCSSFKTFLHGDDTVLTMSHRYTKHLETVVNIELEKVAHWLDGNQLTLNFSKTNYMLMGQQKGKFEITINSKTINQENNVCYLGVILDDKLYWLKHVDYLVKKLSIAAGMIYKLRPYLSQKLLITSGDSSFLWLLGLYINSVKKTVKKAIK